MNNFQKTEKIGRKYFEKLLQNAKVTDYKFTKDPYLSWDCEYTIGDTTYLAEIKVRNCTSTQYQDFILESHKVEAIKAEAATRENRTVGVYANFFSDGIAALWNIDNVSSTTPEIIKYCAKTTAYDNGYTEKKVRMITLNQAAKIGPYVTTVA